MGLYTLRPISDRSNFRGVHKTAAFRATWTTTYRTLAFELHELRARSVVLEIDVRERDIRVDGELRAAARPDGPGVRLCFDSKHGPLTYATDRFWTWQDNVRAVALGLEALRRVDRYGITRRGEQYAGWKQLTSGALALGRAPMTAEEAAAVLLAAADVEPGELEGVALYRVARSRAHPDRNAGDRSAWDQVEAAGRALGLAS
jgi:hypothetical protein